MHSKRKFAALTVVLVATTGLIMGEALAGNHWNAAHNTSKGCGQLVTLKHPDLKGPGRKKEWNKCMADPDAYNQ